MFKKIGALKNLENSQKKKCVGVSFLINLRKVKFWLLPQKLEVVELENHIQISFLNLLIK